MARATLKDVAKKAGVSTATVSYVLNGKKKSISDETKTKVMTAVRQLDYVTDMSAKSLVMKDSKLIGVVIPQTEEKNHKIFSNNFYSEILGAIEFKAREKGYQILVSGLDVDDDFLRIAHQRNLDGIIAIGVYSDRLYKLKKKLDIPVVLVDSYCRNTDFVNIRIDDVQGSYMAAEYMIRHGHRKIAFMCGTLNDSGVMRKRFMGYQKALEDNGITYKDAWLYEGNVDFQSGKEMAEKIVSDHTAITAIVTTADILAIGAMKGFINAGKKIPDDYSIIGFDDIVICDYVTPGLTTVKQQISEKGEEAMEMLANEIKGSKDLKDVILPVQIVERNSVRSI
ncbi:MAG: LacI family transcriptional regulator [Lachnospiraceae bacterium]|jgi:DNA-binding LacI/PurR family transcriptional regulator|nr:LacI family transcriptional regulator [Lachnospiraceae bacterium]